jgi:hemolysin-activating ACP:hemolysin acyltransferase
MFSPTYIKDLNQQYTGVCVSRSTIKNTTDEIIKFYRQFDRYDQVTYEELYQQISPCVRLDQYRLFRNRGRIVGFTNWAFVNDRVLDRFMEKGQLGTQDWQSGFKMLWLELISQDHMDTMMAWMKDYSVNLLGENVRIYWVRSQQDKIMKKMKIRTKKSWRKANG